MREIKFRAWDIDERKMVELGSLLDILSGVTLTRRELEAFNFMQYTGLKDKNGVEICEGDIVRIYDGDISLHRVMWCIEWDYPAFDLEPSISYTDSNNLSFAVCNDSADIEVIGNIYENPELKEQL